MLPAWRPERAAAIAPAPPTKSPPRSARPVPTRAPRPSREARRPRLPARSDSPSFSAVYTESPFLLLVSGELLAASLRQWWLAGILGALAALTRSYGAFLILPYAVLYWQQHGLYLSRWIPNGVSVALPILGPTGF